MNSRQRHMISIDGHSKVIQVTDDGSRTVLDSRSGVAYHSASGAVAETRHVYLVNSGIADRLAQSRSTALLEIGFGTGLAMLLTLDAALAGGAKLHYTAVEAELLDADLLGRLQMERYLRDPTLLDGFLRWRSGLSDPAPRGTLIWRPTANQRVTIEHRDATAWARAADEHTQFDAIYFDPFAPEQNAELWQTSFLHYMHRTLKPNTTLVTYCVSRAVREAMQAAGFRVQRVPGPAGGKRQVMIAWKD